MAVNSRCRQTIWLCFVILVFYVQNSLVEDHFWLDNCAPIISLDCVSTPSPVIFEFSTKFINGSWPNISVPLPHVNDYSVLFVLWGCVGLAVSKIILSAISICVSISKCSGFISISSAHFI